MAVGTINESTVKTPDRTIETGSRISQSSTVEGSQEVDGKVALDNDVISAQVTSDLPNPSDLAHKLSNVQVIDDYSQFKNHVKTSSIRVLENGVDVTSQYTIEDNAGTGIITATRKDPSTTPAGKVQMNVSFQINADTPSGTTFKNTPISVINKSRVTGQEVTLTTYQQTTDKHWTEGSQVVDDKTYIASDTINARVEMSLPDPSTLTKKLTKVQLSMIIRSWPSMFRILVISALKKTARTLPINTRLLRPMVISRPRAKIQAPRQPGQWR